MSVKERPLPWREPSGWEESIRYRVTDECCVLLGKAICGSSSDMMVSWVSHYLDMTRGVSNIQTHFEERQLYAARTQLGATMEAEQDCPWAWVSFLLGCVLSKSAREGHCPSVAGGRVPADSWCSSRTSSPRLQDPQAVRITCQDSDTIQRH